MAITYQLTTPGHAPQEYRLHYNAAGGLARVETPAQGIFVLADLSAGQAQIVVPFLHAFVEAPDFSDLTRMIAHAGGAASPRSAMEDTPAWAARNTSL